MARNKHLIIFVLIAAIIASYGVPKTKYKGSALLSTLGIPYETAGWYGINVADKLNLNDLRYNFINKVFARSYTDFRGKSLLWIMLDAGNFHNPKVCFESSGFKAVDLPDAELTLGNRIIKATTLYFENGAESYFVIYWICIDKNLVDWKKQKLIQLWHSLSNKEKTSLMIRFDVPMPLEDKNEAVNLVNDFISHISSRIEPEQAEYIFGKER